MLYLFHFEEQFRYPFVFVSDLGIAVAEDFNLPAVI
jgi:hypothetical protein